MNFQLHFCNDGILRLSFSKNEPLIALKFLQQKENLNDFIFWSKWSSSIVLFEKELSFYNFFKCLEPWLDFFSHITQKDLKSYFEEMKQPCINKNESKIQWIGLTYYMQCNIKEEFLPDNEELIDFNNLLSKAFTTRLTGQWGIDSGYRLNGYKYNDSSAYGIEFTKLNYLKNIPLFLNPEQYILFFNFHAKRHLEDLRLFELNAFAVGTFPDTNSPFMMGTKDHFFINVIQGFFNSWFASPEERKTFVSKLENSYLKTNQDLNSVNNENSKKIEEINPNAFSLLIENQRKEASYWNNLIKESQHSNINLKTEFNRQDKLPEKRIINMLISDEDTTTIPKPTDFKTFLGKK